MGLNPLVKGIGLMEFQKMDFKKELAKVSPKLRRGADIYIWGAGGGWEEIREEYRILHNISLEDYIFAFVDNNPEEQKMKFYGKKVISPDNIDIDNAVVLICISKEINKDHAVENQLIEMGFSFRNDFFDIVYFNWLSRRYRDYQFSQFKDIHTGKRCFIVGNGPSLKPSDLELLRDEITFASNHIYLVYDNTSWRPTYYVSQDDLFMVAEHKNFSKIVKGIKFFEIDSTLLCEDFEAENAYFFSLDLRAFHKQLPYKVEFSNEPGLYYWTSTVTYTCLQMAAFMGFDKIFLLGVDNNFPVMRTSNGEIMYTDSKSHFHADYRKFYYAPDIDLLNSGYETAREHAKENEYKIYNATRGGKLEVFERVDFDSLF